MKARIGAFLKYFLILNVVAFYYGFILFVQFAILNIDFNYFNRAINVDNK